MTVLNKITDFFKEDYFVAGRRIVGLKESILEAPIKEVKIKYINLFDKSYKVDVLSGKIAKSAVIQESRLLFALRIASFVTLIFPLVGMVFCLLSKTPEIKNSFKKDWGERFIPGNEKEFAYDIKVLIDCATRSGITPSSFKKESLLTMTGGGLGINDLTVFYAEDYHLSAEVAHHASKNTLKVPLKERIHLKFYRYGHKGYDRFEEQQPSLKGSTVVLASQPYMGQKLPKAVELYFKYLEKKQKANAIT